jgi:UDP-N-acetyl-2-amino-2-deoxyglucuronate dehydrogenase
MTEPLRVGLVGCGSMGREHLHIMARIPDARLVGVCDHYEPGAQRAGAEYGVPYWTDLERFYTEAKPQAIHLCSPSGLHADQGIAAAERGIHVLSEKPLDLNLEKVDRLIALCDRQNVRLGCIFQRRMSRAMQTVQRAIADGSMGRLLSCSVAIKWWRSPEYYQSSGWRGTWAMDGGVLANQGIHTLDQMVWMAGPVAEVEYAHLETVRHQIEVEDFALVVVRFENGARGTIEATTCCRPDLASRIEIYGTNGSASFQDACVLSFGLDGQDILPTLEDRGHLTGGGSEPMAISLAGHEAQIRDFYRAIIENRTPIVDGREARASVDLLTKIYAKAFPGQKLGT